MGKINVQMNKERCALIKTGYLNLYKFPEENENITIKKRHKIIF